jgi:stress response protein SCP2
MALNLNKGSRFNLSKEAPKLKVAGIGLGWNPNEEPDGPDFDLESHVVLNHQRPDVVLFAIGCEALYEGRDRVVFQGETEGGQGLHVV